MLTPFAYAAVPHQRKHGPQGYVNYQEYKDWLRDEFTFRCVYCLEREMWYPSRAAAFSVDHVIPQVEDDSLICIYDNLVYACVRCNAAKRDVKLLDPTATGFGQHLRVEPDGSITALTVEGKDLIAMLHLDKRPAVDVRAEYLRRLRLKEQYPSDQLIHRHFLEAFQYPDELPDLGALRPPRGNSRAAGKESSYFARRQSNQLHPDEIY
jgi:5-methylcytosine-specific restriction endonuclease McrA